jgi:GalNAc5-diNAcBac-PP-undecaprenol beta-1,3-glucosyltransferase
MGVARVFEATVVVPTYDHGPTLRHSVGSALRQTVDDIEVLIVGDGMPDDAREVALELGRSDERVRVLVNPKGESRGELHRHAALGEARGQLVFYLSDDDLWFPDHLESMTASTAAAGADFVHAPPIWRMGDGSHYRWIVDLAQSRYRQLLFERANRVPLSSCAHTLAAYRDLPHGWRVTPPGEYTDAWMWRQFAEQPGTVFACSLRPTVLHLPSSLRAGRTPGERLDELAACVAMLEDPARRLELMTELFESELERLTWLETRSWELEEWLADREEAIAWQGQRADRAEAMIQSMRASARWRAGERLARLRNRLISRR